MEVPILQLLANTEKTQDFAIRLSGLVGAHLQQSYDTA